MPGVMLKAVYSFPHLIIKFNIFAHTLTQQISNVPGRTPGSGDTGDRHGPHFEGQWAETDKDALIRIQCDRSERKKLRAHTESSW